MTALKCFEALQSDWVAAGKNLDDKGRVRLPFRGQQFSVSPTEDHVNVWQFKGRFEGDEEFWRRGLSDARLTLRSEQEGLKFALQTAEDFRFFMRAVAVVEDSGLDALSRVDPVTLKAGRSG